MAGVETYILTIENDAKNTMITSLQKDNKELLKENQSINLEEVDKASAQLTEAINPTQQAETAEEQNNGLPQSLQENTEISTPRLDNNTEEFKNVLKNTTLILKV